MSVIIESTTDTKKQVMEALGKVESKETVGEQSDASEKADAENLDDVSEASTESKEEDQSKSKDGEEDEEDGDEEEQKDAQPKKPLKGFKKRIDKLSKRASLAEAERDALRLELAQARLAKEQNQNNVEAPKEATGKPKAENYDTHEEYVEALTDWKIEQKQKEAESKKATEQVKSEQEKIMDQFQAGVKDFKANHEDFDDVMESVDDIPLSAAVQTLILESKNGPELSYHLAKNKEELARICKLSPLATARELGKFEASLTTKATETKTIKTTKAPAPINPVGSKGSAASSMKPEEMSYQDFKKWREKRA